MKTEHKLDRNLDLIAKGGTAAWQRLKKGRSWADWLKVGEALLVLREEAMNQAGIPLTQNAPPSGSAYANAMQRLLDQYKLHDIDKNTRADILSVIDRRATVEPWYKALPLNIRLNLNHPTAVLRRYKREHSDPKPEGPKKETTLEKTEKALAEALARVTELEHENAGLKAHVAELEAARRADIIDNGPLAQAGVIEPKRRRKQKEAA